MAKGNLNLLVSKADFERRITVVEMRMQSLKDVVDRYRNAKSNLDQFITGEDDNFQDMCARIDVNIDAAGRAYAALQEIKAQLENTVSQMDQMSGKVKDTITSATEAAKSSVQAALKINSVL